MTDETGLVDLGWGPRWRDLFEPHAASDRIPGRVVRSDRGSSLVATAAGVLRAKPSVRLLKATGDSVGLPVVGDWVVVSASEDLDVPLIHAVLERKSAIVRGDSGRTSDRQALAANLDTVFVVHPIADPPNLRRIERELSLAWSANATPVVVLSKADLSPDPEAALAAVESAAPGVDVVLVNARDAESAGRLLAHVKSRRTAVLIGPSGAGKSTLLNSLLGERRQATGDVREADGRGRHTTVARELVALPDHGMIIDTPGLRAIGLSASETGILSTFADIEELARSCHFRDCRHVDEPKCAVRAAAESGGLSPDRLSSYHKLVRENEVAAMKTDAHLRAQEKRKWKTISKAVREFKKRTGRE
jgi:ribosome biogenesis GTPase